MNLFYVFRDGTEVKSHLNQASGFKFRSHPVRAIGTTCLRNRYARFPSTGRAGHH